MNRICVIDIAGLSGRLIDRDRSLWLHSLAYGPQPMRPTLPVSRACVQASMTTGAAPGVHGVIGEGIFRRQACQLSFDERSNTLLNKKRFWHSKDNLARKFKTSLVFWSNPLAGAADVVLGAMTHGPSGIMLADQPVGLYKEAAEEIGPCDTSLLRGPAASWAGAAWIARAAQWIWRVEKPQLQWVYLPGLDFELIRHGLDSPHAFEATRAMDLIAAGLAAHVQADGGQVIVVSDGGYVNVHNVGFPNIRLRQAGLLKVVQTDLGEMVDYENSAAFAMVDQQVAHIFCKDAAAISAAAQALAECPAVASVLPREDVFCDGLGRERAGELLAFSAPDAWLSYQWWTDERQTPRPAGRWDVEGKCGYDPCELFAGEGQPGQIDPNPTRVRASRGLLTTDQADWPILAASCDLSAGQDISVTDLPNLINPLLRGGA